MMVVAVGMEVEVEVHPWCVLQYGRSIIKHQVYVKYWVEWSNSVTY